MIRVTLSDDDLARTRLVHSPIWEAVASSTLLFWPEKSTPRSAYRRWAEAARSTLADLDLSPLGALVCQSSGYIPDFLLPVPDGPSPRIEAELDRLRATEPERVAAEARLAWPDATPEEVRPFLERPSEAVAQLADLLAEYWRRTLASQWPRMRALLDGEVIRCAHRLAQGGTEALLCELAPRIRWEPPVLVVEKKHTAAVEAGGRGLLLVPLVFGNAAAFVSVDGPWRPTISYAPRGVGLLWSEPEDTGCEAPLELLLGRGRASVLLALGEPASTSALSLRLGVSPSTVSQHLAVLARSGVVARRRAGRLVLYVLTPRGERLVELLAGADEAAEVA